jgi:hypothetical protein
MTFRVLLVLIIAPLMLVLIIDQVWPGAIHNGAESKAVHVQGRSRASRNHWG